MLCSMLLALNILLGLGPPRYFFAVVNEASTNDELPSFATVPTATLYSLSGSRNPSGTENEVTLPAKVALIVRPDASC